MRSVKEDEEDEDPVEGFEVVPDAVHDAFVDKESNRHVVERALPGCIDRVSVVCVIPRCRADTYRSLCQRMDT